MEFIKEENLRKKFKRTFSDIRIRPDSGKLWLDFIFLVLIATLQLAIIPSIFGQYLAVDLLTPWLVVCFVRQRQTTSVFLAFFAALILETHTSTPSGLYFCVYWITLTIIHFVKDSLSWRHNIPWMVTIFCAQLWLIIFECFVILFLRSMDSFNLLFVVNCIFRLLFSVVFGQFIRLKREIYDVDKEGSSFS